MRQPSDGMEIKQTNQFLCATEVGAQLEMGLLTGDHPFGRKTVQERLRQRDTMQQLFPAAKQ